MLPNEILVGLSFEKDNPVWKSVHILIDASIDSENAVALSKDVKGEDRAWHCGRADALKAFKQILIDTRNAVLQDQGRPLEEDNPS